MVGRHGKVKAEEGEGRRKREIRAEREIMQEMEEKSSEDWVRG